MKLNLSIFAILYSTALFADAQIGGAVSWNKDTEQNDSSTSATEILVTGLGQSPEAAEKQALTAAVRQAVGAYLDSNTLLENEAVIRDRILSFSNGFVETYKATAPAKKNSDGLYEVTILATVKSSQVIEALKSNNLISAKIAGQNLWAEAATKVQNAQDSLAFLNEKLPELLKTLIKLEFLDKNGNPTRSIEPAVQIQNAEEITATWYVRLSVDQKTYFKSFAPVLVKCLQNITGAKGEKFQLSKPELLEYPSGRCWDANYKFGPIKRNKETQPPFKTFLYLYENKIPIKSKSIFIIEKASLNFDFIEGILFKNNEYNFLISSKNELKWSISVELINGDGEMLAKSSVNIVEPFTIKGEGFSDGILRDTNDQPDGALVQVGPFICTNYYRGSIIGVDPIVPISLRIPINAMKDVRNIECKIDMPADFQFIIKPALEN